MDYNEFSTLLNHNQLSCKMENSRCRKWAIDVRFLIALPEDHKIGVKSKQYYKADNWFDSMRRYLHGENGETLVTHLMDLTEESKELIVLYPEHKDKNIALIQELILSVNRLIDVYEKCDKDWIVSCLQEIKADLVEIE